jgi:hypothetical protein
VPHRSAGWRTAVAGTTEAEALIAEAGGLIERRRNGLTRAWTADTLRWRLAAPGRAYLVHHGGDALVVSASHHAGPLRVAVILGVFCADLLSGRRCRQIQRTVAAAHRTPLGTHGGINADAPLPGWPLPSRLRPSPLTLIVRELDGSPVAAPGRFEFLDFDAF